jgi:O-antigen ligase
MNRALVAVCAISLFLLGISILLTFTRGIWLSIFFSTVIMSAILSYKRTIMLILGFGILIGGLFLAWPKFQDRMLHTKNVAANMERINLFNVNIQMWKEHPILGIGYGENVRRNREYWDRPEWNMPPEYMTSHAHNQFLNVLTTTGVLGLIPFVIFMSFFFFRNIKVLKRATPGSAGYILLFCCLWGQIEFLLACLTDVSFEYAKIRALLVLIWAIVIATERKLAAGSLDTI